MTRPRATALRHKLVVPAYFHPAVRPEDWAVLAEEADRLRLVVLNVASGPGTLIDPVFLPPLQRLRAAGVAVAGYVDTAYGARNAQDVLADFRRYLDWYPQVRGVFFDRVATGAEHLRHYAGLARSIRALGATQVAFNHGAHPVPEYAEHADLVGTFEGPWSAYVDLTIPRWVRDATPDRFFHLVYATPHDRVPDAMTLAGQRNAGNVFATHHGGNNPWRCLPDRPELERIAAR